MYLQICPPTHEERLEILDGGSALSCFSVLERQLFCECPAKHELILIKINEGVFGELALTSKVAHEVGFMQDFVSYQCHWDRRGRSSGIYFQRNLTQCRAKIYTQHRVPLGLDQIYWCPQRRVCRRCSFLV